ncbi:hypothetical protein Bpfe_015568 [Biomphalaria pfeifferi]|uniref:Uncharacterized protein n=1 Tax=Biomphalaria pfeifferi TaxID=112525 RepID=A0AAD8F7Y2_BIOPF|nr:hypothetical protein Bpfe_015568 [Biomphalaria pfeifferi]
MATNHPISSTLSSASQRQTKTVSDMISALRHGESKLKRITRYQELENGLMRHHSCVPKTSGITVPT